MISKLRNISYEMRLKECGLTTLETRRLRGDQIEVFKILNGYENIDRNMLTLILWGRFIQGPRKCPHEIAGCLARTNVIIRIDYNYVLFLSISFIFVRK